MFSRRNDRQPVPLIALSPTALTMAASEGDYVIHFIIDADGRASRIETTLGCKPIDVAARVLQ